MPSACNYPAEIERDEDGRFVVTFPDFGWGATDGAALAEALAEARDLLRELIAATIREGGRVPAPSRGGRGTAPCGACPTGLAPRCAAWGSERTSPPMKRSNRSRVSYRIARFAN